jgi:hypothetical protein
LFSPKKFKEINAFSFFVKVLYVEILQQKTLYLRLYRILRYRRCCYCGFSGCVVLGVGVRLRACGLFRPIACGAAPPLFFCEFVVGVSGLACGGGGFIVGGGGRLFRPPRLPPRFGLSLLCAALSARCLLSAAAC